MAFPVAASAQGLAFFMFNKPYLPIADQNSLLRARGMAVDDKAKAAEYLQRIGYYRLSAYWHPMRKRDAASGSVLDGLIDGATFKEVTNLYTFDGRLRLIMLDALERLEISLPTEVALQLGEPHPLAHRSLSLLGPDFAVPENPQEPIKHGRCCMDQVRRGTRPTRDGIQALRSKLRRPSSVIRLSMQTPILASVFDF
jgi:hypothetical protein